MEVEDQTAQRQEIPKRSFVCSVHIHDHALSMSRSTACWCSVRLHPCPCSFNGLPPARLRRDSSMSRALHSHQSIQVSKTGVTDPVQVNMFPTQSWLDATSASASRSEWLLTKSTDIQEGRRLSSKNHTIVATVITWCPRYSLYGLDYKALNAACRKTL